MAYISMYKECAKELAVDGSLGARVWEFSQKLLKDHTQPGLHIEPIKGSADKRVRTGRVTKGVRAVMFEVSKKTDPEPHFLLAAVKNHDEANRFAETAVLRVNPVNGVLELTSTEGPETAPASTGGSHAPPRESPRGPLVAYTINDLTKRVGINDAVAEAALKAADEDELLGVISRAPAWQQDALLALATGESLDSVVDLLREGQQEADRLSREDSEIERAYANPVSQMEFVKITDDDQLKRVLQGSFEEWRTYLHPEQRRYAYRKSYNGAFRLSGGAGTGKTVVAVHRASFLARNPAARIVLTTYTTTLADNLAQHLRKLDPGIQLAKRLDDPGVYVAGIDKLARDVTVKAGEAALAKAAPYLGRLPVGRSMLLDAQDLPLWEEALDEAATPLRPELRKPRFAMAEYRSVVLGNRITTKEGYVRVSRAGRGVRLSRTDRLALWEVFDAYRHKLADLGQVTFPEAASIAATALDNMAKAKGHRLADHVIVDESQDLHVSHWRLLRALVRPGHNDLFVCEDSHQRIFGEKVVLGHVGIEIRGRSRRLTLNYRTTRQNLDFAVGVLKNAGVTDMEGEPEETAGYRSPLTGPAPRLLMAKDLSGELDLVARTLGAWLDEPGAEPDTVAVLVRSGPVRDVIQRALVERGVQARSVDKQPRRNVGSPQVLTMHRAKGLEFRKVIVAGVDESQIPDERTARLYAEEDVADIRQREKLLLYVACTRARDELVVTWHGRPSPFLPERSKAAAK